MTPIDIALLPPDGGPAPGLGTRRTGAGAVQEAAVAFESVFLAEMLKHAGVGRAREGFGGGFGEGAFSAMLTREYADRIARQGLTGIADRVAGALATRGMP